MKKILLLLYTLFLQQSFCQETSWTLIQAGEDIYNGQINADWPNRNDIESLDLKPAPGGFLTCGYYNNQIFDSTDGNTYSLLNKNGAYLAKYNYAGVLQWLVHTEKAQSEERNIIMSIATDSQDNIYIIGHSDGTLYDTTGEAQAISPQWTNGGSSLFLMKFNKDGEFIWKTLITGTDPKRVAVDNNDNVVVCGQFWGQDGANLFFNDQYEGSFSDITNNDVNYYIAKYRYDGMPLWDAGIYISSVNSKFLEGITFDSDNNIYLNGVYEQKLRVYDADEENYIERNWSGYYGGSMFFAKYTPEGDAQWIINSDDTTLSEIITNPDGSHYLTGINPVLNGEGSQIMTNADGTTITQNTYGPYYFARITPEGTWDWVTGSTGASRAESFEMIKYGDKISIMGALGNWGSQETTTGAIHGTDISTEISIDAADVFIATYDLEGKLFSVSKSGNTGNDVGPQATSGFMRDENGFFYIQRNLFNYLNIDTQDFYGQAISPINGNDAAITKFKESDGEMVYLGTKKINPESVKVTPNPTGSDFVISLGNTYSQADVVITDISGKMIFQKTYQNVKEIPGKISGTVGVYIAKVIADGEMQTFKVIKK